MHYIKILGAAGNRTGNSNTTCIQVSKNTVIDAGNIMHGLGEDARHIDNIFFSHSHLDHIVDCAFLIDNYFSSRQKPLNIYGLPHTVKTLKENIFNSHVWPDFSKIPLKNRDIPSLKYMPIEYGRSYDIDANISLTPIPSVHTVPTCGYIIRYRQNAILFTSDTFKNPDIWKLLETNSDIKTLIIDVSFPNELSEIAKQSKHLTPKFLSEELQNLQRDDIKIYINHIKPSYKDRILRELNEIGITKESILLGGETILYC